MLFVLLASLAVLSSGAANAATRLYVFLDNQTLELEGEARTTLQWCQYR
jgi:hypothetical protein